MKRNSLTFLMLLTVSPIVMSQSLTLEQIIDTGLNRSLVLETESENIKIKELEKIDADRLRWPSLNLSASTSNSNLENQSASASIGVNQPLYQGGSISTQQNIADVELKKAALNLLRKKQTLVKDLQLAYIDILEAKALTEEEKLSLTRLQEQARISKILYSEGDVWKNDALQADVSIAQGETQVIAAENKILRSKSNLNVLLNYEIDQTIDVLGELVWKKQDWSWGQIRKTVEEKHPELMIAKINEDIANLRINVQRASNRPTVNLSSALSQSESFTGSSSGATNLSVTLSANWTFWDGGNINRAISASRIEKQKASFALHNQRQSILKQAQLSWLSLNEAASQVSVLKQAIGIAQENYRVNTVRYQEKLGTANDLLTAQTLLSKSKKDWLSALARYAKAVYTLKFNMGEGS